TRRRGSPPDDPRRRPVPPRERPRRPRAVRGPRPPQRRARPRRGRAPPRGRQPAPRRGRCPRGRRDVVRPGAHPLRHHHRCRRGRRRARRHHRRLPPSREHRPGRGRGLMVLSLLVLPLGTAALVLALSRHATLAAMIAVAGSAASLVLSAVALAGAPEGPEGAPFAEGRARGADLVLGGIDLPLGVALSSTSAFLVLVVSLVVAAVQTYSAWYLADDGNRGVFHATVALFAAAMLLVVLSADLVLTIVGWEVMGWCSYLLIGHWSSRPRPRRAAHTAFIVTRIADIGLLLG